MATEKQEQKGAETTQPPATRTARNFFFLFVSFTDGTKELLGPFNTKAEMDQQLSNLGFVSTVRVIFGREKTIKVQSKVTFN